MDLEKIEGRIDRAVAGGTEVSMSLGGVQIKDLGQLLEIAKMMSIAGIAVPYHLRGNPGACLAVAMRALRNGFDPFELAEHSYTMKKSQKSPDGRWEDVETIAFDSFVIRAIIDAHSDLTGAIRYTYEGEGDDMVCIATATPKGAKEPIVHRSPTLGELRAARGRNDKGQIKGSPLWDTKPQQQMAYDTGRDLCRRYFPAVLLGWHDRDEMDENVVVERAAEPVKTSGLRARLAKPKEPQDGFDHAKINKTIDGEIAKSSSPENSGPVAPPGLGSEKAPSDPGCFPVAGSGGAHADDARSVPASSAIPSDPPPQPALCGEPAVVAGPDGSAATLPSGESIAETPLPTEGAGDGDKGGAVGPPAVPPEADPPMVAYQKAGEPGPPFNGTYKGGKPVDETGARIIPKHGHEYAAYVDAELASFTTIEDTKTWWGSSFEKNLRNKLLNFTSEMMEEAKAKVQAKVAQIKESASRNKGEQG